MRLLAWKRLRIAAHVGSCNRVHYHGRVSFYQILDELNNQRPRGQQIRVLFVNAKVFDWDRGWIRSIAAHISVRFLHR